MIKIKKKYQINKIDKYIMSRGLIDEVNACKKGIHHHSHDGDSSDYKRNMKFGGKPMLFKR